MQIPVVKFNSPNRRPNCGISAANLVEFRIMKRPETTEFPEFYAEYTKLVPEEDILPVLSAQPAEMRTLFAGVPEHLGSFAYDAEKWTVKQVLGHVLDTERILGYRLLRIARGDQTPIEGFEQDDYIEFGRFNSRTIQDLIGDLELVRKANMSLLESLNEDDFARQGTANNNRFTARAIALIMAGHVRHHLGILETKYLI